MKSYSAMMDMARKFIVDCEITDSKEVFEASLVSMYLVDDISEVMQAYVEDLKALEDLKAVDDEAVSCFEDEEVGQFLDRHNINWE